MSVERFTRRLSLRLNPILIVDDEPSIRARLRQQVARIGRKTIILAANGLEAFQALPALKRPCLVLLDVRMPVLGGLAFLSLLAERADRDDFFVIVMSSDPSNAEEVKGRPRVMEFLRKPVRVEDLKRIVDRYLPAPESRVEEASPPSGTSTILIAEHDDSVRSALEDVTRENFPTASIYLAGTVDEVMEYASSLKPPCAAVLHWTLAGDRLPECIGRLREASATIVLTSAWKVQRPDHIDIDRFLQKPFELSEYVASLQSVLGGEGR